MRSKQVTYAHRRSKKRPLSSPDSSPLEEITDPEVKISRKEMERRMLKRSKKSNADSNDCLSDQNTRAPTTTSSKDLQTNPPVPEQAISQRMSTAMNPSSAPSTPARRPPDLILTSGGLIPPNSTQAHDVPHSSKRKAPSPKPSSRIKKVSRSTSSSRLKENNNKDLPRRKSSNNILKDQKALGTARSSTHRKSAGYSVLASPFTSRPTSPQGSPRRSATPQERSSAQTAVPRRALSDTHFDPNIPSENRTRNYIQSATSSPNRGNTNAETLRTRRPSAPSAIAVRPDQSIFTNNDLREDLANTMSFFDLTRNFPRGPQIDFNRPPSQLSFTSSYDERFFDDVQGVSTPLKNRKSCPSPDGDFALQYDEGIETTWITDSIISPPTMKRAYSWPSAKNIPPASNEDRDSLELGVLEKRSKTSDASYGAQVPVPARGVIEDLLASLDLGNESQTLTSPSHSIESQKPDASLLDSPVRLSSVDPGIGQQPRGRDRRGTLRASDFQRAETEPIRPPPFTRTRSGTVVQAPGPCRKRDRSGTVTAGPRDSVSRPPSTGSTLSSQQRNSSPNLDLNEKTACRSLDDDEDELNIKEGWFDEVWTVASPPSPIVPRRQGRGVKNWRSGHVLGKGVGTWGMKSHNEDDGTDDPLLLI